jgi:hypothetical protein
VKGRYYWAPDDAPMYPGPHYWSSERWIHEPVDVPYLGEVQGAKRKRTNGVLGTDTPPAVLVPGPSPCDGSGLVGDAVTTPLIAGVDQLCWINAGVDPPDWEPPVATPDHLAKFTEVFNQLTASRISDPGTGPVVVDGPLQTEMLLMVVQAAPPEPPPPGMAVLWPQDNNLWLLFHDQGPFQLQLVLEGTPHQVSKFSDTGLWQVNSRITDPGTGRLTIDALTDIRRSMRLLWEAGPQWVAFGTSHSPNDNGILEISVTGTAPPAANARLQLAWYIISTDPRAQLVLDCPSGVGVPRYGAALPGQGPKLGIWMEDGGWGVAAGIVYAMPTTAETISNLGLGSAAFMDTEDFALAEEALPPGGSAGQVLAKASGTDYDTEWVDEPAASLTVVEGVLSGNHTITSANGTWETTNISLTLPAGTWLISAQIRFDFLFTAGSSGSLNGRLLNETDNVVVTGSNASGLILLFQTDFRYSGYAYMSAPPYTIAGTKTIRLQVSRNLATTWSISRVLDARTAVTAIKVG